MFFSEVIRVALVHRGWSDGQLAGRVGLSREQVGKLARGERRGSVAALVRIAVELDLDLNLLKQDPDLLLPEEEEQEEVSCE